MQEKPVLMGRVYVRPDRAREKHTCAQQLAHISTHRCDDFTVTISWLLPQQPRVSCELWCFSGSDVSLCILLRIGKREAEAWYIMCQTGGSDFSGLIVENLRFTGIQPSVKECLSINYFPCSWTLFVEKIKYFIYLVFAGVFDVIQFIYSLLIP